MVDRSKRLIFVTALVITMLTASVYGANLIYAQDTATQSTLVAQIAKKFGLKTEDVQAVFDQEREQRHAEMEAKYEQSLTDAVKNGELTEAKKALILAKHKEIESDRKATLGTIDALSKTERKAVMDKKKADLKAWAEANGVDLKYLLPGIGRGWHGFGKGMRNFR